MSEKVFLAANKHGFIAVLATKYDAFSKTESPFVPPGINVAR